jgi:hypothetical protein
MLNEWQCKPHNLMAMLFINELCTYGFIAA